MRLSRLAAFLLPWLLACAAPSGAQAPDAHARGSGPSAPAADTSARATSADAGARGAAAEARTPAVDAPIELVESWPEGTALDHADVRDAKDVWPELFAQARERIDLAEFYYSNEPGSQLERSIVALEQALKRGVQVRLLADAKFAKTYPETIERLAKAGAQARTIDFKPLAGGVLHAKYFVVDAREAYLGSQNFDWRSLQHIQELGVRVRIPGVVRELQDTFDTDWGLAGGEPKTFRVHHDVTFPQDGVTAALSPKGWLPDEKLWDLPMLVQLVDSAKSTVRVQLLTYKADFPELEDALKRAALRGVQVQLLVSDWTLRKGTLPGLQQLAAFGANDAHGKLEVHFVSIPPAAQGFIPFARTVHAKYLVVDGQRGWVGTSNWERGYFYGTRNVGVVVDGGRIPQQLDAIFTGGFSAPTAHPLEPGRSYEPPRIGE